MRSSSRRSDEADVIRARLRALLAERDGPGGWVPDDDPEDAADDLHDADGLSVDPAARAAPDAGLPAGLGRHRAPGPAVRWSAGLHGTWALWLAALLAALLAVAWSWLDRPRVDPVPDRPSATAPAPSPASPSVGEVAETSSTVVVSVVGLVARPGLVTLPSGSRVADALAAAGGTLPGADPASVNVAAVLADGQQIAIGVPGAGAGGAGPGDDGGGTSPGGAGRVNLNVATVTELDGLPGIGPVLAQRIVAHREEHGPFRAVEELDEIEGIGPATAAELAELVTV